MAKKHRACFSKRLSAPELSRSGIATASNGGTGRVRRTLTAEFLSDAHLGSGAGGGGIDALVARDKHGCP